MKFDPFPPPNFGRHKWMVPWDFETNKIMHVSYCNHNKKYFSTIFLMNKTEKPFISMLPDRFSQYNRQATPLEAMPGTGRPRHTAPWARPTKNVKKPPESNV